MGERQSGDTWASRSSVALPLSEPILQAVSSILKTPSVEKCPPAHILPREHLPHLTYHHFMEENEKLKKPAPLPRPQPLFHHIKGCTVTMCEGLCDGFPQSLKETRFWREWCREVFACLLACFLQPKALALKVNVFRQIKANCWSAPGSRDGARPFSWQTEVGDVTGTPGAGPAGMNPTPVVSHTYDHPTGAHSWRRPCGKPAGPG